MPVNPALKQRLVQQFQQKQQENSLAAQASIAAAHSNEQPRSSGSKEEAAVVQIVAPHVPSAVAPPLPATETECPAASALDEPKVIESYDAPNKKSTCGPKPVPEKQQAGHALQPYAQAAVLGKREREDQAPAKPQKPPSFTNPENKLQKQPSIKRTKSTQPPPPQPTSEPATTAATAPKFIKKVETVATTPLEILSSLDGRTPPRPAGHIPAPSFASYSELWTAVRRVCGDQVNRTIARLCYQDSEDDWIALLPGTPFPFFTKSVKKVLVVPLVKKESSNLMK